MKFPILKISAARMVHSFHALSVVDGASIKFLERMNLYIERKQKTSSKPLETRKALLGLQKVQMVVGNSPCHRDFIFTGMEFFSNLYFSAALWE